MKLRIKKQTITSSVPAKESVIWWRNLSIEKRQDAYDKLSIHALVCWDCGKRVDVARVFGVTVSDGEIKLVFICPECKSWRDRTKDEQKEAVTVKLKAGKIVDGGEEKKEKSNGKNKKGLVPFAPTKGKSGLGVKQTMIYGLDKGLRGDKLVKFLEKEYPSRKTDWSKAIPARTRKFEAGKYKAMVKEIRKAVK